MEIAASVAELHLRNDTFPGEVFIELAIDALDVAGAARDRPIEHSGLLERFLPECDFRGRENNKMKFALLAAASARGGLDVDLLDEVVWWRTDDFWRYGLLAAITYVRAAAAARELPVAAVAHEIADQHGITLIER